jgi:hypothetical protein
MQWYSPAVLSSDSAVLKELKNSMTRGRMTKLEVIISRTLTKEGIKPERIGKLMSEYLGAFHLDLKKWDITPAPKVDKLMWPPLWKEVSQYVDETGKQKTT